MCVCVCVCVCVLRYREPTIAATVTELTMHQSSVHNSWSSLVLLTDIHVLLVEVFHLRHASCCQHRSTWLRIPSVHFNYLSLCLHTLCLLVWLFLCYRFHSLQCLLTEQYRTNIHTLMTALWFKQLPYSCLPYLIAIVYWQYCLLTAKAWYIASMQRNIQCHRVFQSGPVLVQFNQYATLYIYTDVQ